MRENRLSGSEGGATLIPSSLPLSIGKSLRDNRLTAVHEIEATSVGPLRACATLRTALPPKRLLDERATLARARIAAWQILLQNQR
jgi:hypothetical protein